MAKTSIADVIVPEIFAAYVIKQTKELSALIQSGIAVQNDKLDDLVTQGGKLINMPFWAPITGDDEVLSDSAALTADQTALVDNTDKLAQAEKDLLKRLVSSAGEPEKPPAKKKQAQGQ